MCFIYIVQINLINDVVGRYPCAHIFASFLLSPSTLPKQDWKMRFKEPLVLSQDVRQGEKIKKILNISI